MDEQKFKKEVRIWALVIINRGCTHQINAISQKILSNCLAMNPPTFLTFLLHITDPEDIDFTMHCKNIWVNMEEFAQTKNTQVVAQF